MWLLKVSDSLEPALEWTDNSKVRKYAVLSHTWQHGQELTFQEMQRGQGKEKSGYAKIINTCLQALRDGIDYVWVDTVCINKTSSAELTEAINSMWKWYCDAEVCYALLNDVDSACPELKDIEEDWSSDTLEDPEDQQPWAKTFAASKWFRRGWTLQELLAPESLIFFNAGWQRIGTKASLLNRVNAVTGIDKLALEVRQSIPSFVIARRMCWAAKRETTRIEDRAYSLLGIFGISIPMLYGEGEKAFIRLQEELIRSSTDHSIFAWEWTKAAQLQDDMLLATNPDQFFPKGRRMIYWLGNITDRPFHLTNRGIDFEGITFEEKKKRNKPASLANEAWVILNCRDENDASALALQVVQQDRYTVNVDHSSLIKNKAYWVASQPGSSRVHTWKRTIPNGQRVTLLRNHLASNWSTTLTPRFCISLEPGLEQSFQFVDGWPARLWQEGLDTMSLPRQSNYPAFITASVSIRFKGYSTGSFLHIAFCFSPINGRRKPLISLSKSTQEEARKKLANVNDPECPCPEDDDEDVDAIMPKISQPEPFRRPSSDTESSSDEETRGRKPLRAVAYTRLVDSGTDQLVFSAKLIHVERNPDHRVYMIETLWAGSTLELDAKEKNQRKERGRDQRSYERSETYGRTLIKFGC